MHLLWDLDPASAKNVGKTMTWVSQQDGSVCHRFGGVEYSGMMLVPANLLINDHIKSGLSRIDRARAQKTYEMRKFNYCKKLRKGKGDQAKGEFARCIRKQL